MYVCGKCVWEMDKSEYKKSFFHHISLDISFFIDTFDRMSSGSQQDVSCQPEDTLCGECFH